MDSDMKSIGAARPEGATDSSAQIRFNRPNIAAINRMLQASIMARKLLCDSADHWIFDPTVAPPSVLYGMSPDDEIKHRQEAASYIQMIGTRLHLHQACVNTAITYMHRFFMLHSFTVTNNLRIARASFFLASRVEGCPRKAREIINASHQSTFPNELGDLENRALYVQMIEDEIQLHETFGGMKDVIHQKQYIDNICALLHAPKDLEDTANFVCNSLLHLTTVCLYHSPAIIACICVEMTRAWMNLAFHVSNEGKQWFQYVDETLTQQRLDDIVKETLNMLERYPNEIQQLLNFFKSQRNSTPQGEKGNDWSLEEQEQEESKDNGQGTQQIAEKVRGSKKREVHQEEQSEDNVQKNKKRKKNAM